VNASWDILKTLSDPTRLRLLALVSREELSVAELQEILGMGQSRISSQLALLRQVNLVTDRREAQPMGRYGAVVAMTALTTGARCVRRVVTAYAWPDRVRYYVAPVSVPA
jgi:DNA-binding transcriptional ArsR family regulator